jgi:hypothetical protein
VHFGSATFSAGTVDFGNAKFSGGEVDFMGAMFSGGTVNLSRAIARTVPPRFDAWSAGPPAGLLLPLSDTAAAARSERADTT